MNQSEIEKVDPEEIIRELKILIDRLILKKNSINNEKDLSTTSPH